MSASTASSEVVFGMKDQIQFRKRIESMSEFGAASAGVAVRDNVHRFSSEKGFWVEVASPNLSS